MATGARGRKGPGSVLVPAAIRAPEVLSATETILNAQAVETFAKAVGGRDALIEALSVADRAPEVEHIVNLLIDPRFSRYSLPKLCTMAGLTVADLFAAYRKALIARAHLQAAHIIAAKLPPIVEDVMNRATPTPIVCPGCHAEADKQPTCAVCHGSGATLSEPDLDRQKLALELGHLTEKKAGLVVQQNAIAAGSSAAVTALTAHGQRGALEQLQQAVGDLLFSPARQRQASPFPTAGHAIDPLDATPVVEGDLPVEDLPLGGDAPGDDEEDEEEETEEQEDEPEDEDEASEPGTP